jgi:ABC-type branched-subunit amino acid transport system substrate-binding protein
MQNAASPNPTNRGNTPRKSRRRAIAYIFIFIFIVLVPITVFSNFLSDRLGLLISVIGCLLSFLQIPDFYSFLAEAFSFGSKPTWPKNMIKKPLWKIPMIFVFLGTISFDILNVYLCYNFHLGRWEILITTFLILLIPIPLFEKFIRKMIRKKTSFYENLSRKLSTFLLKTLKIQLMSTLSIILFLTCGSWHTYLQHISDACNGNAGISLGVGAEVIGRECVGISNGIVPFDLQSPDRDMKLQAAEDLKQGEPSKAEGALDDAINNDPNDAEAHIYLEDLQIPNNSFHITAIVDVTLTGQYMAYGREILRGAYTKQEENNKQCLAHSQCVYLYLLIANTGSGYHQESDNANYIARQMTSIVTAEQRHESHFNLVGVIDGLSSQSAIDINHILTADSPNYVLPMVAAVATSDYLSTAFAFLRVVPPNTSQGYFGAYYAQNVLHARKIAILYREENSYSGDLRDDFRRAIYNPSEIVATQGYQANDSNSVTTALNNALSAANPPELIYCACYSNEVNIVLKALSTKSQFHHIRILGGDTFYELENYDASVKPYMNHLFFTALGYPDPHHNFSPSFPGFLSEYSKIFTNSFQADSGRINSGVMTAYDATLVLMTAATNAFALQKQTIAPAHLQVALFQIKGDHAVQGLTGSISFSSSGVSKADPVNKALFLLSFDTHGNPINEGMCGQFSHTLKNPPCDPSAE